MTSDNPRLRVSTATPQLTPRDAARHRVLIEPPERRQSAWLEASSIGEVLDTPAPERCAIRSRWYSRAREEGGFIAKACGDKTCPVCVFTWLEGNAARAWASWNGGPVVVADYATSKAWEYARGLAGIKMQGPNAAVGVLDIPHGDARRVFVPDPDGIRGPALDAAYVEAIRAFPIPPFVPGEYAGPSLTFGTIPKWLSTAEALSMARVAGLTVTVAGQRQVRYRGSPEATEAWIAMMRGAA